MNPFNSDAVNMLSSKNFNQDFTLKSPLDQQPVIIMFYRDGCPHCVHFKPTFAKAAESDRSVVYAAVDTAQNQDLMQRLSNTPNAPFQIQGVPTVAGFNAGKYVKNFEEERTAENVMKFTSSLGGASANAKGKIYMIGTENFNKDFTLKEPLRSQNTVILFYSDNCPHCVHFKPEYMQAAADDSAVYCAVNVDKNQQLMQALDGKNSPFDVSGVPTIVSFHGGKFYSKFGGKRNSQNVQNYARTIGTAPVAFIKK